MNCNSCDLIGLHWCCMDKQMQGIISGRNISTCSFQKEFGLNDLMIVIIVHLFCL